MWHICKHNFSLLIIWLIIVLLLKGSNLMEYVHNLPSTIKNILFYIDIWILKKINQILCVPNLNFNPQSIDVSNYNIFTHFQNGYRKNTFETILGSILVPIIYNPLVYSKPFFSQAVYARGNYSLFQLQKGPKNVASQLYFRGHYSFSLLRWKTGGALTDCSRMFASVSNLVWHVNDTNFGAVFVCLYSIQPLKVSNFDFFRNICVA